MPSAAVSLTLAPASTRARTDSRSPTRAANSSAVNPFPPAAAMPGPPPLPRSAGGDQEPGGRKVVPVSSPVEGCGAVALRRVDVDLLLDQMIDSLGIASLGGVDEAEVTIGPCRNRGQEKARQGDQRLLHSDQLS